MKILGIEHIAIATNSLKETSPFWDVILGLNHIVTEQLTDEGVTTSIYDSGKGKIEFLSELGDDSPIRKFLKTRGPGIHHICFEVDDIDSAIKELTDRGIQLIKNKPSVGAEGYRVVFIHPKSAGGVLVELCQK